MQLNNIAPSVHSQNQSSNLIIVPVWRKAEIEAVPKDYSLESVQKEIRENKQVNDTTVNLSVDFVSVAAQLEEAKAQIKKYEDIKREAEAKILDAIGDAGKSVLANGCSLARKLVARKAYEIPATSFITLGVKGGAA